MHFFTVSNFDAETEQQLLQHSQLSISPPNGSFQSIFLAHLLFLKLVGCSSLKHVHRSAQVVTTLCGCRCSSRFDIFFYFFFLIHILLLH